MLVKWPEKEGNVAFQLVSIALREGALAVSLAGHWDQSLQSPS